MMKVHALTSSTRRENAVARSGFHPSVCRDWHWPRAAFGLHEAVPLCGSPHAAQPIRREGRPEGWKGGREEGAELIQVSRAARALPCTAGEDPSFGVRDASPGGVYGCVLAGRVKVGAGLLHAGARGRRRRVAASGTNGGRRVCIRALASSERGLGSRHEAAVARSHSAGSAGTARTDGRGRARVARTARAPRRDRRRCCASAWHQGKRTCALVRRAASVNSPRAVGDALARSWHGGRRACRRRAQTEGCVMIIRVNKAT